MWQAPTVDWLEDLHLHATDSLPEWLGVYVDAGSGDELTVADAASAWDRLRLRPRAFADVSAVSTSTTVLGTEVTTPILVSPAAMQSALHAEGDAATATAVAGAGSLFCLSMRSGTPVEKVAATGAPWWAQTYLLRDRDLTVRYVERVVEAGATALVLTGDTPIIGRRPRTDKYPEIAPVYDKHTRANLDWNPDGDAPPENLWQASNVTVGAISWLAELSGLPIVVKGVLRGDDARRCADAGAAAVFVSNHGGRQLDGAISTAEALPEVVDALDGTGVEVYVDGGIRRGTHALRALALGARAVFVGRPALWGLASSGSDGVRTVLDGLTDELLHAMMLAGVPSLSQLTSDLISFR